MLVRVLGPVEVAGRDGPSELTAGKERTLLAALAAEVNRAVSVERLVDEVWGESAPRTAVRTLHTYVSHLRRLLPGAIQTKPAGYVLELAPELLDSTAFQQRTAEARLALMRGQAQLAAEVFGDALALWRGDAYAGVDGREIIRVDAARLDELRLLATENWLDAQLAAGHAREMIGEVEALVAEQPLRERLWATLLRALHAAGRTADALRAYQRARAILVEELGVEPSMELRAVEQGILAGADIAAVSAPNPAVSYAMTADGLKIGYWVRDGRGPDSVGDVVFCAEIFFHLELLSDFKELWAFLEPITDGRRLIAVQRRSTGVSDRDPSTLLPPPEECVADIDAVLDAVGSERASLVGWGHGGQVALAYAALRPERVDKVAVVNSTARLSATPDYPEGVPKEMLEALSDLVASVWGTYRPLLPIFDPAIAHDPDVIVRVSRIERLTASPRDAARLRSELDDFDIRPLLPSVISPVLVAGLSGSVTPFAAVKFLADELPDAEFVELPGAFVPTLPDAATVGKTVAAFLET